MVVSVGGQNAGVVSSVSLTRCAGKMRWVIVPGAESGTAQSLGEMASSFEPAEGCEVV